MLIRRTATEVLNCLFGNKLRKLIYRDPQTCLLRAWFFLFWLFPILGWGFGLLIGLALVVVASFVVVLFFQASKDLVLLVTIKYWFGIYLFFKQSDTMWLGFLFVYFFDGVYLLLPKKWQPYLLLYTTLSCNLIFTAFIPAIVELPPCP